MGKPVRIPVLVRGMPSEVLGKECPGCGEDHPLDDDEHFTVFWKSDGLCMDCPAREQPCSICDTLTKPEFLSDVSSRAPLAERACPACIEELAADELDAEEHGESCECAVCKRVRTRADERALQREAQTRGGLSDEGVSALGWAGGVGVKMDWVITQWTAQHPKHGTFFVSMYVCDKTYRANRVHEVSSSQNACELLLADGSVDAARTLSDLPTLESAIRACEKRIDALDAELARAERPGLASADPAAPAEVSDVA